MNSYIFLVTVGSYVIPKNSVIVSSVDHIHQYSKFYKDPELFIPDRFIHMTKTIAGAANSNYQERDQFLFGWGRRLCPGTYLVSKYKTSQSTRS
jgi:cytochrome P450